MGRVTQTSTQGLPEESKRALKRNVPCKLYHLVPLMPTWHTWGHQLPYSEIKGSFWKKKGGKPALSCSLMRSLIYLHIILSRKGGNAISLLLHKGAKECFWLDAHLSMNSFNAKMRKNRKVKLNCKKPRGPEGWGWAASTSACNTKHSLWSSCVFGGVNWIQEAPSQSPQQKYSVCAAMNVQNLLHASIQPLVLTIQNTCFKMFINPEIWQWWMPVTCFIKEPKERHD